MRLNDRELARLEELVNGGRRWSMAETLSAADAMTDAMIQQAQMVENVHENAANQAADNAHMQEVMDHVNQAEHDQAEHAAEHDAVNEGGDHEGGDHEGGDHEGGDHEGGGGGEGRLEIGSFGELTQGGLSLSQLVGARSKALRRKRKAVTA